MVSVKRAVGQTPFSRALRFTTKAEHVSRFAKPKKEAFFELPAQISQKLSEQISAAERKSGVRSLGKWNAMQSVLRQAEGYHGRKPTHSQAVAALAMRHGLSGEGLKPEVDALIALNIRAKNQKQPLLSDSHLAISNVVKKNGLAKVRGVLEKTHAPISTGALAKKAGLTRTEANQALIVLESMRMATQLPKAGGQKTSSYSWIAAENRLLPKTKPGSNTSYLVLEALHGGPKSLMDLFEPVQFFGRSVGKGKLDRHKLRTAIPNLEKQGLIFCETRQVKTANHPIRFYSLTELGRRLLKEQQGRASIHPELRKILVGRRFTGQMPSETRRMEKIIRYLKVRKEYGQAPRKKHVQRGTLRALMKKYNLSLPEIDRILAGKNPPWQAVSFETLKHVFVPAMYKVSPAEARWFEVYLNKNESGLRHTKQFRRTKGFVSPLELFEKNQGLAFRAVGKFWARSFYIFEKEGITREDLNQDALLELQRAADAFDPGKAKFSTFATTYIQNMLSRKRRDLQAQKRQANVVSLDLESKDGDPIYAAIEDKKQLTAVGSGERKAFVSIIKSLKANEGHKEMAIDYFGLRDGKTKTIYEIAQKNGITRQAVQQAIARVVEELRRNPRMQQFKGLL